MKYPYGTIACIIGAALNAFCAGMDFVNERGAALIFNALISILCVGFAIHLSLQCWSLKERLFKAYMGSDND